CARVSGHTEGTVENFDYW
nr:immunoglobulin heavy chain junction region [Macaca mulatta]MOX59030.1 immunoglobulin heavy chain junction region [Macaca mulatta]MOX61118.1 immunoglobulin heavy chain junction region [Macaca mulatta]MOX62365.1 immunoglobulin heavy chain junction region [Macaca mulatta]MOX62418.1 immunoglobulin heavy chain junction region [Macaca mulatta]